MKLFQDTAIFFYYFSIFRIWSYFRTLNFFFLLFFNISNILFQDTAIFFLYYFSIFRIWSYFRTLQFFLLFFNIYWNSNFFSIIFQNLLKQLVVFYLSFLSGSGIMFLNAESCNIVCTSFSILLRTFLLSSKAKLLILCFPSFVRSTIQ